jgi:hypothetical protein
MKPCHFRPRALASHSLSRSSRGRQPARCACTTLGENWEMLRGAVQPCTAFLPSPGGGGPLAQRAGWGDLSAGANVSISPTIGRKRDHRNTAPRTDRHPTPPASTMRSIVDCGRPSPSRAPPGEGKKERGAPDKTRTHFLGRVGWGRGIGGVGNVWPRYPIDGFSPGASPTPTLPREGRERERSIASVDMTRTSETPY